MKHILKRIAHVLLLCALLTSCGEVLDTALTDETNATHIATLPPPVLQNILSYTDATTCVATYQLSGAYLEALDLRNKALTRDRLLVPKVLGNNFVATQAWKKLDVAVSDLPELSPALIAEVKRLHQLKQQPLLVLDLGKSIAEMERLCKAKGVDVFSTAYSYVEILPADSYYDASVSNAPFWMLLLGSDHGVLQSSRNKTYDDQVLYMKANYQSYQVGGVRELVNLTILKYLQDETLLFSINPVTWGICKELSSQSEASWYGYHIGLGTVAGDIPSGFEGLKVCTLYTGPEFRFQEYGLFCVYVAG